MFDFHSPEVRFAIDAVAQAALVAQRVQQRLVTPALLKSDRSPVTVADYAVQAIIGRNLDAGYPDVPLVGEEDASELKRPEGRETLERVTGFVCEIATAATPAQVCRWIDRGGAEPGPKFWTLDPIDGTKGFIRGDQYAVALALVVDGVVQIGALGCPNLDTRGEPDVGGVGAVFAAVRGKGARVRRLDSTGELTPIHASDCDDPSRARMLGSYESGHTNDSQLLALERELALSAAPIRMDSQAKFALLATGQGEFLFRLLSPDRPDYREKIWDQAAGLIVIEEAGGRVTDLDGKPLDFTRGRSLTANRGVIATNGKLHDAALDVIKKINA